MVYYKKKYYKIEIKKSNYIKHKKIIYVLYFLFYSINFFYEQRITKNFFSFT